MIKTENVIYNKSTGAVHCDSCKSQLGVLHNPTMSLTLCAVCNCEEFCEINIDKVKGKGENIALDVDNSIICRSCGEMLFNIEKASVISFAFRAKCSCGAVIEKAEEYRKASRRLGEYAGLLEEG